MMTRIKIVSNETPDADGEWLEIPVDLPIRTRWKIMESLVMPFIPTGFNVVAIERGSQSRDTKIKGPTLIAH
jgi:hypothetical protein